MLSPPHTLSYLYPHPLLFLFRPHSSLKNIPALTVSIFFSLARSLCFFFFFLLDSRTVVHNVVQMGHLRPKAVGLAWSRRSSSSLTQPKWVRWLLSSSFFCYDLINFKIVFLSLYSNNLIMLEFRDV